MPLSIRDPRAGILARSLAKRRKTNMTEAIVSALEAELARERASAPLSARLFAIADDLADKARPGGRRMTRAEIDRLWGN
jgi:antitoxin VapB